MIRWGLKYYIVQSIFEADIYHYFDAHGTVKIELFHNTVKIELFHNTVKIELFHNTVKIELFHNTVKIELFHNCGYSTDV
jgi:hypothetical protein